ncbi:MAG: glutamate synthase subunit beta [Chloroflexi bacterium]|nr:glutamate synthase subunit beta [Chloroflexota bacterium]
MGKPTGFVEFRRDPPKRRPVAERLKDWREVYQDWPEPNIRAQGARCMGCAIPFCHTGCPLGNIIPDFNDLVYKGEWLRALDALLATNNFPEFTGRICPAPCEAACVLSINDDPVTIEYIEKALADRGHAEGWIVAQPPPRRTGRKVAVVGSGPAGLAAAQQLNRAGHAVTVFERDRYIGGLLTLGIPDFKLEKQVVQRRVNLMREEGIEFRAGVNVGVDLPVAELRRSFDAILLACGATQARDLPVPGRELGGIHLAMEYLAQQNRLLAGEQIAPAERITAAGKRVVILGGGDTGADCLGTAHRQGAVQVHQFEILPEPPQARRPDNPWPQWPQVLRSSPAHEEGGSRDYSISTVAFSGRDGKVRKLHAVRVEWVAPDGTGRPVMREVPGSEFELETELVLLALGFLGPERSGLLAGLGVKLDARGNVQVDRNRMTSVPGVFAAGDSVRGASLVVWAIAEGREAARGVDLHLMGTTGLPQVLSR